MNLLQMSFSGAILTVAIIAVRAVFIHKLPKRTFLALWGIVLLRLLIPFSIPSVWSAYSLINRAEPVMETISDMPISDLIPTAPARQIPSDGNTVQTLPEDNGVQTQILQGGMQVSVWTVIWCVGTMLCIAFFIISYLHWRFKFKTSLPVSDPFITQ